MCWPSWWKILIHGSRGWTGMTPDFCSHMLYHVNSYGSQRKASMYVQPLGSRNSDFQDRSTVAEKTV